MACHYCRKGDHNYSNEITRGRLESGGGAMDHLTGWTTMQSINQSKRKAFADNASAIRGTESNSNLSHDRDVRAGRFVDETR